MVDRPQAGTSVAELILIVDDDPAMVARLRRIVLAAGYPEASCIGAASVAGARAVPGTDRLVLALIDLGLPDGSGVDLVAWLRSRHDDLPILVVSAWSTEEMIMGALRVGASGYMLKERDDLELGLSLRSVLNGGAPIDPFIARRILWQLGPPATPPPAVASDDVRLSAREADILTFVSRGLTNREIAELLKISRWTVECHIKRIYRKLAVHSRTEAVHEARSSGLLR
ncbi:LuxR C-terminal-related transcriptional regulator [Inquilinus sp. CA228]|uniref:LuxR C-terminal-related transcriptional regulator n=1 Tax=Inquilinus sp. CA228 TaxID=3455609 RepID=UPI003F8CF45F